MKKTFETSIIFGFKFSTVEYSIISGKVKRLISTEENTTINFWVDGDRREGFFLDSFDMTRETPLFAKIESLGDDKDDWIACIATASGELEIDEKPYENIFDSSYVNELQKQGYTIKMYYYAINYKQEFTLLPSNSLFVEKPPVLKDLIYTGGFWGVSHNFNLVNDTFSGFYYNVESIENNVFFKQYNDIPLGMSYSNNINLKETGAMEAPFYSRITRVPIETKEGYSMFLSVNSLKAFLQKKGIAEDDISIISNTFHSKQFLKSNSQNYYSYALNTSPIYHYKDYKYMNTFSGQITKHSFFGSE